MAAASDGFSATISTVTPMAGACVRLLLLLLGRRHADSAGDVRAAARGADGSAGLL